MSDKHYHDYYFNFQKKKIFKYGDLKNVEQ